MVTVQEVQKVLMQAEQFSYVESARVPGGQGHVGRGAILFPLQTVQLLASPEQF